MTGTSLLAEVLLVFVILPGAVTLLVSKRWLPVWLGLLALCELWAWSEPLDGPSAVFAYFGIIVISVLNGAIIVARILKIAIDRDRQQ